MSHFSVSDYSVAHSIECIKTGESVTATVARLDPATAKAKIDATWWKGVAQKDDAPDSEWKWAEIVQKLRYGSENDCVALQTPDGEIQGAIIVSSNGISGLTDAGSVLIKYLAVSPSNRDVLADPPRYNHCGTELVLFAACHSYSLGLNGRVCGFVLPESEEFYLALGFVPTGKTNGEECVLFELPPETAMSWMESRGILE